MNWLFLVAIAVILDSARIFIDNYVSDVYFKKNGAVSQKIFYGCIHTIIAIIILVATNFSIFQTNFATVGLITLSGILVGLSGIPYYKALEIEDSTNLGIFIQLAPILYLIFGWIFLGDTFSPLQLVAFLTILIAPTLIVLTARKRSRKIKLKAALYAFLYVLMAVIGNLLFVKANTGDKINFISEIALLFLIRGVINIIIVYCRPKWRKRFKTITKDNKKVFRPMLINALFGATKDFAYRGALVTAPTVALASATTDSAVPIVIFFMGILLTLIWPKFGREKLDRKTIITHLIATILVVTGILILQI